MGWHLNGDDGPYDLTPRPDPTKDRRARSRPVTASRYPSGQSGAHSTHSETPARDDSRDLWRGHALNCFRRCQPNGRISTPTRDRRRRPCAPRQRLVQVRGVQRATIAATGAAFGLLAAQQDPHTSRLPHLVVERVYLAANRPAKSCATSSARWHSPSPVSTTSQAGATHKPRRSGKVRVPYMTFIPWLADVATVVCAVLLWLIYRVVREEYHLTIEGDVVSASPRPPDGYVLTFTLTNTGRHRIVITALVNTSYGESWKLDTQPPPPYVLDPSDQKLLACAWDALSSRPTSIWAIDSSKRRWYMNRKQLRELVFRYQSSHHS